jgi:hypothetical protein
VTLLELLPEIKQLEVEDKLTLIRILVDDLDLDADLAPLLIPKTLYFATPYNSYGAARVLMEALSEEDVA